jgi:hypothetical protein
MNRRALLLALGFFPFGGEARNRKHKRKKRKLKNPTKNLTFADVRPANLIIADHTADWAAAIQEAIATINPLLPEWHPQLSYEHRDVIPLQPDGKDGEVAIYEVPVLVNERGVGEAYYSAWHKVPGHQGRISLKSTYPAQSWVVIHELMHVLAAVYEHTGWDDLKPPFDASLIRREDIQA